MTAMTTAAIMQPTYLPYLGYFQLMAASDVFVFLDDVQFARRSWQSRNRILTAQGELMLTIPVRKHDRDTPISAIEIDDSQGWREKHLAALRHAYGKRPAFAEGWAFVFEQLAQHRDGRLADLTCDMARAAAAKIGLTPRLVRASELGAEGARSEHLLAVCRAVGATHYVSPTGSVDYMEEDGVFAAAGFPARFQAFRPVSYPQGPGEFVPFMGFVDALMNVGWAGMAALVSPKP
ncbi:hypothetical protein AQ619_14005 [Caulobacter henricii]|uniref:WbqC-like protein n=2 Tax=Caulobacter henricii TaxID=69395 RepID=A0A0P0P276_9CAUL|nr:WbqC family protein [Caulobacter henricii]ALL14368.1 hypothetical protein AQ619_14005 [Caulobacter henricii]